MKKYVVSILIALSLILCMCIPTFAATIENVEINFPEIKAEIEDESGTFDASGITAKLGDKELTLGNSDIKSQNVEWIIFVDTSKSISDKHFEAQKKAIASIYESLGENDKFQLYTFDETVVKVLDGSESKEDAVKKINAIKCEGQDTQFYDVLDKMTALAKESEADLVKPVIYTDGVDTISKITKEEITKELEEGSTPIYGYYASAVDSNKSKELNSLLKKSGGEAKSFTVENAANTLSNTKSNRIAVTFIVDGEVAASDNAVFSIDLGDGNAIEKEVKVEEYIPETSAEAETSEDVGETDEGEDIQSEEGSSFNPLLIAIPVIVIAAAAVAVILLKKKKAAPAADDNGQGSDEGNSGEVSESAGETEGVEGEAGKDDGKKKKAVKKKKDEPEVQFYFVNK